MGLSAVNLTDLAAPTYIQMLGAMADWLDKAAAQMPPAEAEALLAARLAPDMFPLATQVRFACVQALEGMYRLRDEEFSPLVAALLDEGRAAGDHPGALAEARGRIAEVIAALRDLAEGAIVDEPSRALAHSLPNGMTFDFTAGQYLRDWALP